MRVSARSGTPHRGTLIELRLDTIRCRRARDKLRTDEQQRRTGEFLRGENRKLGECRIDDALVGKRRIFDDRYRQRPGLVAGNCPDMLRQAAVAAAAGFEFR